jgi:hypothetical protein
LRLLYLLFAFIIFAFCVYYICFLRLLYLLFTFIIFAFCICYICFLHLLYLLFAFVIFAFCVCYISGFLWFCFHAPCSCSAILAAAASVAESYAASSAAPASAMRLVVTGISCSMPPDSPEMQVQQTFSCRVCASLPLALQLAFRNLRRLRAAVSGKSIVCFRMIEAMLLR